MANVFEYKCKSCDTTYTNYQTSKWDEDGNLILIPCPRCGFENSTRGSKASGDRVRYSRNLGITPAQMRDKATMERYMEFHPGAELNSKGQLKISNRTEKLRRMKEHSKMTGQTLVEND